MIDGFIPDTAIINIKKLISSSGEAERRSGNVCINGAATHLIHKGDLVIIASYCQLSYEESRNHQPKIVHMNSQNQVVSSIAEEAVLI